METQRHGVKMRDGFQYDPLPSRHHFRLLTIRPQLSSADDDLRCGLAVYSIDDPPPYSAISYTWGSSELVASISIEDHSVPVTRNLVRALKELPPKTDGERLVWIDAICINQVDMAERTSQVQLMKYIFSGAGNVFAWIGDNMPPGSQSAEQNRDLVDWLKETAAMKEGFRRGGRMQQIARSKTTRKGRSSSRPRVPLKQTATSSTSWKGLMLDKGYLLPGVDAMPLNFHVTPILTSAWASRAWILQEVSLAQSCDLYWSQVEIGWDVFVKALQKIYRLRTTPSPEMRLFMCKDWCRKVTRCSRSGAVGKPVRYSPMSWMQVLPVVSAVHSGDARDKIYSVLGLVPASEAAPFSPDYTRNARDLYIDLARYLQRTEGPEFLALVDHNEEISKSGGSVPPQLRRLPSWVPDLVEKSCAGHHLRKLGAMKEYVRSHSSRDHFAYMDLSQDADGTLTDQRKRKRKDSRIQAPDAASEESETLRLYGRITDKVVSIGSVNPWLTARGLESDRGQAFAHAMRDWLKMIKRTGRKGDQKNLCKLLLGVDYKVTEDFDNKIFADWPNLAERLMGDDWVSLPQEAMLPHVLSTISLLTQQEFSEWNMATLERRLMFLESGRIGFTPADTRAGDSIVIFAGADRRNPSRFVMRQVEDCWRLIGKCEVYTGSKHDGDDDNDEESGSDDDSDWRALRRDGKSRLFPLQSLVII